MKLNKPEDQFACLDDLPPKAIAPKPFKPAPAAPPLRDVHDAQTPADLLPVVESGRMSSIELFLYVAAVVCFLVAAFVVTRINAAALGLLLLTLAEIYRRS